MKATRKPLLTDSRILGIDIGGTNLSCGIIEHGKLVKEYHTPFSAGAPRDQLLKELFGAINELFDDEITALGIGVPGYIDVEKGEILIIHNISAFKGLNLKELLTEAYNCPVFINNDANCFVLGEKYFGAGKNYRHLIGLTLGTGLGGGIVMNGKLVSGIWGGAGEFGSIAYRHSNYEDYCSSKFFIREYQATGEELFLKAETGDVHALEAFYEFGIHLGNLIKSIMFTLAPEAIVLGGSISKAFRYFEPGINEIIRKFPVEEICKGMFIGVSTISYPEILGAAALYLNEHSELLLKSDSYLFGD